MKEATYYKPQTEEFFLGFEYEISYRLNDGNWQPKVYGWSDAAIPLYFLDYVRVKHLDHDDIVSLGWEGKLSINMVKGYRLKTFSLDWFNDGEIMIYNEESERLFSGHLLNKSELSRLMRQLGIKNEKK